jgi:IS30 family transposase
MGRRRRLSPQERGTLWQLWKDGATLEAIQAGLAAPRSTMFAEIRRWGGIAPPAPRRSARALTLTERELLERWQVGEHGGVGVREAARRLGRAPSTVSREITRNASSTSSPRYAADAAERRAWRRAARPKPSLLAQRPGLCALVAKKLSLAWSPEQISGWLRVTYPSDPTLRISPETIYRSLYVQARGLLKKELTAHLRRGRTQRRPVGRKPHARTGVIIDGASIATRPPEVADRAIPGHWEGDLLAGTLHSHIATLVERASRYTVLVKLGGRDTETVVDALVVAAKRLPESLMTTLTWDRGAELAQHRRFTVATDIAVYFCDPHSPWQRGSNENTNGLLRQYFPKGKDVSHFTQAELDEVAHQLNTRPRKTLGFQTPAAALSRLMRGVALTG